jgi:hypothetical protein
LECLERVKRFSQEYKPFKGRIIAPLFGSKLAGGRWEIIASMIETVLDDRDVVIYVLDEMDLPEKFRPLCHFHSF